MTAYNLLSARMDGGHVDELGGGISLWCNCLIGNSRNLPKVYTVYISINMKRLAVMYM